MSRKSSKTTVLFDKNLTDYIESEITARLDQKIIDIREQINQIQDQFDKASASRISNRATLVAFSGDMDKLMAAFIIATGAASMGMDVSIYVTFWALAAMKKKTCFKGKPFTDMLTSLMLPAGPGRLCTSKMNMLGAGPAFFRYVMKKKNVTSLADLITLARETGVRIIACQMSMEVMGITKDELIDNLDFGGVATYLSDACDSKLTLFI